MKTLLDIFDYLKWPVMMGVALASLILSLQNSNYRKVETLALQQAEQQTPTTIRQTRIEPASSYATAVNIASPSVVNIYTLTKLKRRHPMSGHPLFQRFFNQADLPQQERMRSALGSGVIVTEDGYLLTNYHVVQGADKIVVQLQDGRESTAEVVGEDEENDLAVLKILLNDLKAIPIGSPQDALVGDIVLAIGNPFGMGQTVTQGIISAKGRYGLTENKFENFIQTDAAINPGNSGGALVDVNGNLLGINSTVVDRVGSSNLTGVSLAIPADTALRSLNDIVSFGRVIHGWLGVEARALTPQLANAQNIRLSSGLFVTGVYPNGPADKAGIQPSDIIVRINEHMVDTGKRSIQKVAEGRPGESVTLEVYRNNQLLKVEVVLGRRPEDDTP